MGSNTKSYSDLDLFHLKDLSAKGDLQARFYLAAHYYYADDETQDFEEAAKLFKELADNGNSDAQHILGEMYEYGYGVESDAEEAVRLYKLSAENGNPHGQIALGNRYDDTIGNSEVSDFGGLIKDNLEALFWYLLALKKIEDKKIIDFLNTAIERVKRTLDEEQLATVEERVRKALS
jgi:TPR repeat protein